MQRRLREARLPLPSSEFGDPRRNMLADALQLIDWREDAINFTHPFCRAVAEARW